MLSYMSNISRYKKYLSQIPEFLLSADTVYTTEYNVEEISADFHGISSYVTAPAINAYVMFILSECMKRNIKRIYFMARDGQILFRTAEILCRKMNISIECRYLYCSRLSLRMPVYHLIGEEAFDILLMRGFSLSAYNVLMRVCMSETERNMVYSDIGFDSENEKNMFSREEFDEFSRKLRNSEVYRNIVIKKSHIAYNTAVSYLKQEGLCDNISYAVADTGWTGSMQRSLGQLLSSVSDKKTKITGFYFGMYSPPKSDEYGEYINWYFSDISSMGIKIKFNNNLFECMCSADHGMTLGYKSENGKTVPVLGKVSETNRRLAVHQIECACLFAENISYDVRNINEEMLHEMTRRLLQRIMYCPEKSEAEALGQFEFCDDVSECYMMKLAEPLTEEQLSDCLVSEKLKCRLEHKHNDSELFWNYGTAAVSDVQNKNWYRFNFALWDRARFLINMIK